MNLKEKMKEQDGRIKFIKLIIWIQAIILLAMNYENIKMIITDVWRVIFKN